MSEIDNLEIVIGAEAQSALSGLEKIKAALGGFKQELSGIDTKKFKESMRSFDDFQKKIQDVGKNTVASDSFVELKRQIEAAEKRLDSLLVREDKLKTVGGVDENSKSWRNLQYDIAETCNKLDVFYAKMAEINAAKPEIKIHDYRDNYASDEPEAGVNTAQSESLDKYAAAAQNVAESLNRVTQTAKPAGAAVENLNMDAETGGSKMDRLKAVIATASDAFARFRERLSSSGNTAAFNESMQETIDRIQELKYLMKGMEGGTIDFNSTVYENAAHTLAECTARMNEYKNSVMGGTEETSRLRSVLSGIGSAMASFASKAARAFGSIVVKGAKAAHTALLKLRGSLPSLGKAFEGVGRKFKMMFRLATIMLLRRALMALFTEMKNGFNALAQYSNSIGSEFNKNVSETQANLRQLGYQFVAAFEPIFNVVLPALNALISKINAAVQAIAQLFAALTGKGTWTKATKNVGNYGAGLAKAGGAAKKAKKEIDNLTAGIDELNILQKENEDDSGSGGGAEAGGGVPTLSTEDVDPKWKNIADWLKEMWDKADFTELGKLLGDKLAETLANIPWDKIKENARKLGKSLATFINGFIQGEFDGKSVSWWIGHTIAQAINTAFEFINAFVSNLKWDELGKAFTDLIKGALDNLDWTLIKDTFEKIGRGLADFFNAIFEDTAMWELVGDSFANAFNSVLSMGLEFVRNFKFEQFGAAIGTGLSRAFNGIDWAGLGEFLGKGVTGIFDTLKGFFDSVDWKQCGISIMTGIGSFFSNINWSSISGAISSAIKALHKFMIGLIKGTDWKALPRHICKAIGDFFAGFDWPGMAATLGELLGAAVKAAIDLLGSIWDMLKEAWGDVSDYFSGYIDEAGGNIIEGLWKGIKDAISNAASWVYDNIVKPFIDGFKEGFGIHSPSTVMAEMGGDIIAGLWNGIKEAWSEFWSGVGEKLDSLKEKFSTAFETIKTGAKEKWDGVKSAITEKFGAAKEKAVETAGNLKEKISSAWSTIKDKTGAAWENVKGTVSDKMSAAREKATTAATNLREKVSATWDNLKTKTTNTYQAIKQDTDAKFTALKTALTVTANNLKQFLSQRWDEIKTKAADTWLAIKTDVSGKFENLRTLLQTTANNIKSYLEQTWNNIKTTASNMWQAIKQDVDAKFTALKTALTTTANNIKSMLEQTWNNIKTTASNAWQALKTDVSGKFESLKTALTTTANNIKSTLSSTWDSVKSTASTKWGELKTNVTNLYNALHKTLADVSFTDIGTNIVNGIWKGISDGWDWLKKKVKELANSLLDAAKDALGIESPSKAFRDQVGRWIMPGVTEGMERTLPEAIRDIQDISNSLLSSMQRTMGSAVNVGRFVVDDSQLKGYSANYGDYFTDAAITHRVKQEMGLNSNVQADIDGGRIVEQMKQALDEVVASRLDNMAVDVRRTADKDPRTTVNIGGRVVADEVQRQKSANGFMFTPSFG